MLPQTIERILSHGGGVSINATRYLPLIFNNMQVIWNTFCIGICIISWTAQEILFRNIKKKYYEKWIQIGEPGFQTAFANNFSKFKKMSLTYKYLTKGDKELDSDKSIRRLKIINQVIYVSAF